MQLIESLFWGGITISIMLTWMWLQRLAKSPILNPLMMSVACMCAILLYFGVSYESYFESMWFLDALIEPAVVAFGYPLFRQLRVIKRQWWQLSLICVLSVFFSLTVATLVARALAVDTWVINSLVTMSTTTAIAIETTEALGGSAALAPAMTLIASMSACAFGIYALTVFRVLDERARGFAFGAFAHVVGTATIARESYTSAAYSSTALIMCATLTAAIAPAYVPFLLSLVS